jgi:hypothetical protein
MLTRGLGIPGRGEAWLAALPVAGPPALGELSFATKSGRGGTTGRAAGWPASGRDPEGAPGPEAAGDSGNPAGTGARDPSGRCRGAIIGRGGAGAAGCKPAPAPTGLADGNG